MIKGDTVFMYKGDEVFYGRMVYKLKDKVVFQMNDMSKVQPEEVLDYQIVNPINGVTMVSSKTYVLDPNRNLIVIQVPQNREVQRRKDIRVNTKIVCESDSIMLLGQDRIESKTMKFIVRDISEGGMNIIGNEHLPISTIIMFRMKLENLPLLHLKIKILRVQRHNGYFNYGCMFQNISQEEKAIIAKYVLMKMREEFQTFIQETQIKKERLQNTLDSYKIK